MNQSLQDRLLVNLQNALNLYWEALSIVLKWMEPDTSRVPSWLGRMD